MRKTRVVILVVTLLLAAIGVVMIYSASAIFAYERYRDSAYFLKRHLFYLLVGFTGAAAVMSFDYRRLKAFAKPIMFFAVLFLILLLVPGIGREAGGARRWFKIFYFSFQPSELAKLAVIIYLADFLSRKQHCIKDFVYGFLPSAIGLGAAAGFVLLQPDLGTAISIMVTGAMMYFAAGVRMIYLVSISVMAAPFFYLLIFRVAYRQRRILAFLHPWADPRGAGFQIVQSFLALGSGGLLGVGLGRSQQKLFFLPASHTDFIFSIIGEELGFLGALGVVILFLIFLLNGARIALKTRDLFGQFMAFGIVMKIAFEAAVNIGVSTGCLPTKGLPLPFISYGGSALIFNLVAVGLLLNVARARRDVS